jgi:SAM-dependent methyltransferase
MTETVLRGGRPAAAAPARRNLLSSEGVPVGALNAPWNAFAPLSEDVPRSGRPRLEGPLSGAGAKGLGRTDPGAAGRAALGSGPLASAMPQGCDNAPQALAGDPADWSDAAVAQLALQRSGSIPGRLVKAWAAGDDAPLMAEVARRRAEILTAIMAEAEAEADALAPHLTCCTGGVLVDIGCGHGLIAAALARRLRPAQVVLIDIEDTAHRGHHWGAEGAGYGSLSLAAALAEATGTPARLINPRKDPLPDIRFDAAISILSCGFHYPTETYCEFLTRGIAHGGAVALDLRATRAEAGLEGLASLTRIAPGVEIGRTRKARRMLFRRASPPR